MKQIYLTIFGLLMTVALQAQSAAITGSLKDDESIPLEFANVVLYQAADSSIAKVETSDLDGNFALKGIDAGNYYLVISSIGLESYQQDIELTEGEELALGEISMSTESVELEEAVVTAQRAIVEIKPDRTVFNVQGTINSTGDNALNLLRKAPGVLVDNNDNITVLSRSGVLVYVDGKRLPLSGDELTNYLRNIPAEQIDAIDIITNPSAKYEAEGTAGIIDIRMKRDETHGMNGSVSGSLSHGRYGRGNVNATGNYKNKFMNSYGTLGYSGGTNWNELNFMSELNNVRTRDEIDMENRSDNYNFRWGTDFFINDKHTVGFLLSGNNNTSLSDSYNRVEIGPQEDQSVDSILIANNMGDGKNTSSTYNINYVFRDGDKSFNFDADYGAYGNESYQYQPNIYYENTEDNVLSENINEYTTDTDIDIYTLKADYEQGLFGGKLGLGAKYTKVATDNLFTFYNIIDDVPILNDQRSNRFTYDETVYAGYVNFARQLGEKWNFSAGLRLEQTDSKGELTTFDPSLNEPPVENNYLDFFPSAGLTYQFKPEHAFSINYGRRINRPDYNVLNPFRSQISELSYMQGNPFLNPEIVNNMELGYTLKYRYNFKLSYSKTDDQITRLITPDDIDPRAGYLTWENLAEQTVWAFNIAAPVDITKGWNAFFNVSTSYTDNQADYGNGAVVDVQRFSYNIYQQHTFKLPGKFTGEISGWFSGPGVWGGVFLYEESWSLNLGLQRRFLNDQMNVRLSVRDIFYESGWEGTSDFSGLHAEGNGNWDSRQVSLSVSMNFGNQKVKSRRRTTGLKEAADRVSND